MTFFLKQEKNRAFTPVEMVIVVAIILLFTALIIVNYRAEQADAFLQASATKLAQNFARAKDLAMLAKQYGGKIPSGGYGIHVSTAERSYILFADCNGNHTYDDLNNCGQNDALPEKYEEYVLEPGVVFLVINPGNPQDVVFTPPYPTVTFTPPGETVEIALTLDKDRSKRKTIFVNPVGLIKIK